MKNFISLALLAFILLSLVAVSTPLPTDDETALNKRTSCLYKRNVLGKRTNVKKCPCALAESVFDPDYSDDYQVSEGPVKGLVVFSQDECGSTTVTGFFSKGFEDKNSNYTFQIVNDCGEVIRDLTKGLNVSLSNDDGTKAFTNKFDDFNLNCDNEGILYAPNKLPKRNCYKRDGAYMRVNNNSRFYSRARVRQI